MKDVMHLANLMATDRSFRAAYEVDPGAALAERKLGLSDLESGVLRRVWESIVRRGSIDGDLPIEYPWEWW